MTVKHTPGPWARDWIYGGIRHLNKNVDYEAFCDTETLEKIDAGALNVPNVRVNSADADLITAAPALADALEAALLFHRGGPWTPEDGQRWRLLTGSSDATTKALCDCIRARLLAAGRPE